jgi:hypothetical protein
MSVNEPISPIHIAILAIMLRHLARHQALGAPRQPAERHRHHAPILRASPGTTTTSGRGLISQADQSKLDFLVERFRIFDLDG